jgi:hypothetical protein
MPEQLNPVLPAEPDFEEVGDGEQDRPFFNDFAWREFIALSWPAADTARGEPDLKKKFGDLAGPVVWESWKAVEDLYPPDPLQNPPTPWDTREAVVCARRRGKDGKDEYYSLHDLLPPEKAGKARVLPRLSKLEGVQQGGFVDDEFALVAQNKTFVRYEIRINQAEYDYARDHKVYLLKTLVDQNGPLEFPEGSVTVKAAWRELPDDEQVCRHFYHVPATVVDWKNDGTPVLADRVMGLVGLHIAHKTPKRKNWIWATFEHVDNAEHSPGGISPPSFCSSDQGTTFDTPGTNVPPPTVAEGKPLPKQPTPVEVARKTPVHPITDRINDAYRNHPQVKDTVWRNYRLVATQWPARPGDGPAAQRFPKNEVANVTMETYHQTSGCLNCHAGAGDVKFVFYPELRALDVGAEAPDAGPQRVEKVRALLKHEADRPSRN